MKTWITAAAALLALATDVASAGWEIGGHAKGQLSVRHFEPDEVGAVFVGERVSLGAGDLRLNTAYFRGAWDLRAQAQLLAFRGDLFTPGDDPSADAVASSFLPDPARPDSRQALDLAWTVSEGRSHLLLARMDRLSVGFTRGPVAVRAGRQASSWGNGLVFQVLDLFDPFPPDALDTEYKPGSDMLSAQWLFPGGNDLQMIVVPRSAARNRTLTAAESSAALKWRAFAGPLGLELLAARHYRDTVGGLGLSGNLAGGVWRLDVAGTAPHEGDAVISFLVNLDRSWTVAGKSLYAFVEVFRNGFGETSLDRGIERVDPRLLERIGRGQLFSLGRDEIAGGLRLEWTPLTTLESTVLFNLRDASAYPILHLHHDWSQNRVLDAGIQLGVGGRSTEYGGVPSSGLDALVAPGRTFWARITRYF